MNEQSGRIDVELNAPIFYVSINIILHRKIMIIDGVVVSMIVCMIFQMN